MFYIPIGFVNVAAENDLTLDFLQPSMKRRHNGKAVLKLYWTPCYRTFRESYHGVLKFQSYLILFKKLSGYGSIVSQSIGDTDVPVLLVV